MISDRLSCFFFPFAGNPLTFPREEGIKSGAALKKTDLLFRIREDETACRAALFLNLPAEKQEKLLEAATREFSHRPFNEASINQIIKEAGIPPGQLLHVLSG